MRAGEIAGEIAGELAARAAYLNCSKELWNALHQLQHRPMNWNVVVCAELSGCLQRHVVVVSRWVYLQEAVPSLAPLSHPSAWE